ncbi:MAG: glycosyltransferase [Curtobacterium sp.]
MLSTRVSTALSIPAPLAEYHVTVAHDYFTQRGGAERVAASLITALRPDEVVTAVVEQGASFPLPIAGRTSFLQHLPPLRRDPRLALPLLPLAWRLLRVARGDVVVCSSSGWSHRLRTRPGAVKVVYCHNPARWIYQPEDYFADKGLPVRLLWPVLRGALARGDRRAAATADLYIANSTAVADRIRTAYGVEPVVLHPPMTIDLDGPVEPVYTNADEFFFTIARGRGYKNSESLVRAFAKMPDRDLVVVGDLPARLELPENVQQLSSVSDAQLRWLYQRSTALLSVAREDFGLTPIEANAFGTPVLVLRAGGFLDSVAEGVSGTYIEGPTEAEIIDAVERFPVDWDRAAIRAHAARFSLEHFVEELNRLIADLLAARRPVPAELGAASASGVRG